MNPKTFRLFTFAVLLLGAGVCRAGITVYDPPSSQTGGNFTIYYGLGTPLPGKIAYVTLTRPDGYHYTVAQAENVSDMSQVCYVYASQVGTYRFFYEYSYVSQGVPQTVVSEVDRYISASNHPPQTTGVSANNTSPGVATTLSGSAYDQDGNMQYLYFYVNDPNWSGWQNVGATYSPGTNVSGSLSWTPGTGVLRGAWTAHVRALDATGTWDSNANITSGFLVKWTQTAMVFNIQPITVNTPFSPSYYVTPSGGNGSTGASQFVIAGYTNWGGTQPGTLLQPNNTPSATWTPTAPGTYQFWIQKLGDNDYYNSNVSGPYYLTVTLAPQSTVTISPSSQTISAGQPITFNAAGGSGTGNFVWGGDASGNGGSQTVTFNSTGTHTVTVYRQGDSNYSVSNTATATITVNAIPTTFSFSGGPTFTYDGTTKSVSVGASPSGATYTTSGTYSAASPGSYTAAASAYGNYSGSASYNWSIGKANQGAVALSPSSSSVYPGQNVVLTVSGGSGTGAYLWGGSASGTGASQTVSFGNTGTYTVTVYRQGDGTYNDSNVASATVNVGKPAPAIRYPSQTFVNQEVVFFSASNVSLASVTGVSGLPAPTGAITYTITQGTAVAPAGSNPVGKYLTPWYSTVTIAASYPGDATYAPATASAVFRDVVQYTPTVPTQLRLTLLQSTSFSCAWLASGGMPTAVNPAMYYDVSVNGGASVYTTFTSGLPSAVVDGLSPNTTYSVVVRGRDEFGNTSAWSAPLSVTTLASGASPSYTSRWADVNGDGIADEIFDSGTPVFQTFASDYQMITLNYDDWVIQYVYVPGFSFTGDSFTDDSGDVYYVPGEYEPVWVDQTVAVDIWLVRPTFQFVAEAGYDYKICRQITHRDGSVSLQSVQDLPDMADGIQEWSPDGFWGEPIYYSFPFVLARCSYAPGGCVLNLPGIGSATTGAVGNMNGTVKLPGGIVVKAGTGSGSSTASIAFPSGATVTIDTSGNITGALPAGTVHINGSTNITLSTGVTITPGVGAVTIAGPNGVTVTVGTGGVKLSLPQGLTGTTIANAIDSLGKVLGIGASASNVRIQVDGGGWGAPGNTDLGSLPVGDHTIGVTNDTRNTPASSNILVVTLTIHTASVGLNAPDLAHWNIDNDDNSTEAVGDPQPGADYKQTAVVNGEDDLVPLTLAYTEGSISTGTVSLSLSNNSAIVWEASNKGPTPYLVGPGAKTWNAADTLPSQLWIEGVALGTTEIIFKVNKPDGTQIVSKATPVTFAAAIAGRQPIHSERVQAAQSTEFPNMIGCEWSVTGELTAAYNCIAFTVGIVTRSVWAEVDNTWGNQNSVLEDSDFDAFYAAKGYVLCAESDAEIMLYRTGQPDNSVPGLANPTGIQHAALKMSPQVSGAGRWVMFQSKLGQWVAVEHKKDALNNPSHYGAPYRYYKKQP